MWEVRRPPEKETVARARRDAREGISPSTQAGEFVREEMHHIREGKHGARSAKQAIAIGLSQARRSGVKLSAPKKGKASSATRAKAQRDMRPGRSAGRRKPSSTRSRATLGTLKREGRAAASTKSLSRQTRSAARQRRGASLPPGSPESGAPQGKIRDETRSR